MTLALEDDKPYEKTEWRKNVSPIVQQIFAQKIYIDFVYSLRSLSKSDPKISFRLKKEQIDWLVKTFVRENLGTMEQGNVCLFPLWEQYPESDLYSEEILTLTMNVIL